MTDATGPFQTVELRHTLPNGSWHIDWMLATDSEGAQPLVTFRARQPIHELSTGITIDLERIGDHRPAFLEYEGRVTGGRGEVVRVARGSIERWERNGDRWVLEVSWEALSGGRAIQRLEVYREAGDRWRVSVPSLQRDIR